MKLALATAVAGSMIFASTGSAQAAPIAGAHYDAIGGKPAMRQYATVSADGKRIARYRLTGVGRCSNGKRDEVFIYDVGERRTTVEPDGSFAHSSKPFVSTRKSGGKTVTGRGKIGFTGTASPDGNQLIVEVTGTSRAKGLTCRQSSTVTLVRAGTPGAPAPSPRLSNGRYPGTSSGRVRLGPFSMDALSGDIRGFRLTARVHCVRGRDFTRLFNFVTPLVLPPRDAKTISINDEGVTRAGRRYPGSASLSLAFFRRGAAFGYRGTFQLRLHGVRRGKVIDRCTVPKTRFSATLP